MKTDLRTTAVTTLLTMLAAGAVAQKNDHQNRVNAPFISANLSRKADKPVSASSAPSRRPQAEQRTAPKPVEHTWQPALIRAQSPAPTRVDTRRTADSRQTFDNRRSNDRQTVDTRRTVETGRTVGTRRTSDARNRVGNGFTDTRRTVDTRDRERTGRVDRFNFNINIGFRSDDDNRFRSERLGYRHYLYTPDADQCVASPWYYYSNLPAYLPESQVLIRTAPDIDWGGSPYRYDSFGSAYGNRALNSAVSEISDMFANRDTDALYRLIPSNREVAIYNEGNYMYSLRGSDFQQMMLDNVDNTQTSAFQVTSVRTEGSEATVYCTHEFADSDGGSTTVYQAYRLVPNGSGYAIADFMTSSNPIA